MIMSSPWHITAFYRFFPLTAAEVETKVAELRTAGKDLSMGGLLIVAPEGINGTVAGSAEAITAFKKIIDTMCGPLTYNDSTAEKNPFKRWKVALRDEIISIGDPDMHSFSDQNNHLSPAEWKQAIETEEVVLLDARNVYETDIGTFKGAVDPRLNTFQEFPAAVEAQNIPKDKKILMFCTGGSRCDKAIVSMQNNGYENVYQLKGGILAYLKEFPFTHFDGECFVFDHRVSVDQELLPSQRYHLCIHCGNPGDVHDSCMLCQKTSNICNGCIAQGKPVACSKNCAHKLELKKSFKTESVL
jgi:UPF0176 protein